MERDAQPLKSVAVYCGSASGTRDEFAQAARALGTELARRGLRLVYGGGNVGLMGEVANAALAAGGAVTGVIPTQLVDRELAHPGVELEVVETMAQRKTRMEQLADGYVCLPGGVGTLEELMEVLTMQQLGHVTGPVGLVNVADYWSPLVVMLKRSAQLGFTQRRFTDALVIGHWPTEVLDQFAAWRFPGTKWQ